jgi:hypothetical protein
MSASNAHKGRCTAITKHTEQVKHAHVVHERLREHRLVDLVVAVLAVTDEVDDDVAAPALAPLRRELAHAHNRLDVVAVDVEDRRVDRLGDVGAVRRRA